jgi:hypothetical protein
MEADIVIPAASTTARQNGRMKYSLQWDAIPIGPQAAIEYTPHSGRIVGNPEVIAQERTKELSPVDEGRSLHFRRGVALRVSKFGLRKRDLEYDQLGLSGRFNSGGCFTAVVAK